MRDDVQVTQASGGDVNLVMIGTYGDETVKRLTDREALELAAELCKAAGVPELAPVILEDL